MVGAVIEPPPELLVFFHLAKTGGTTFESILNNVFPAQAVMHCREEDDVVSALSIQPRQAVADQLAAMSPEAREAVRCVIGHLPIGIHTLFERPARYVGVVRHPIDRILSHFHFAKQWGKPGTTLDPSASLDDYVDRRLGLIPFDFQVRVLSGCPELDAPLGLTGESLDIIPVEDRHLALAKENIERLFLAMAPLEAFVELVMLLKHVYGWETRR